MRASDTQNLDSIFVTIAISDTMGDMNCLVESPRQLAATHFVGGL